MANDESDTAFCKIKTQGPLFRITEIFLWDDERIRTSGISTHNAYLNIEPAVCSLFQKENESLCVEEVELAQQMDALGLPLSFGTSKARNKVTSRSKRNGTKANFVSLENEINDPIPEVMIFSQMENPASSTFLHDNTNISSYEDQVDVCYHDAKEHSWGDLQFDESKSLSALGTRNEAFKEPSLDEVNDAICGRLAKSEFSSCTLSFELNAGVPESLSLHDDSPPEEVLEESCSRSQSHHDGDLLNEHHLDRCSDNSSTSCCNMHLKWDTQTLQSYVSEEFPLHQLGDHHNNFMYCERGDWKVIWDPFYESYYFFNVQTLESTWFPPLGFEKYAFDCSKLRRKETHEGASEKNAGSKHSCGSISVESDALSENRDSFHFTDEENKWKDLDEQNGKQQGDRLAYDGHDRRLLTINENGNAFSIPETYTTSSIVLDAAHENVAINKIDRKSHSGKVQRRCPSDSLLKYWHQRYSLFSRFDNGIKMDEESWFSVTPEQIAMHHAFRCGAGTIIDCFTGVGGNAIQFAMRSNHVIAIDVDPQKIDYAQQNAFIYGVSERIDFIKGDFFKIARSFKGDIAFLSPPWGGPDYAKMRTYDISSLKPREGQYLFKIASMIADKVVMFLPRNVDLEQLAGLSFSADPPWNLEVEKNYLNGKVKSITAYFDRTELDYVNYL